jgi:hypothetical protein
MRAKRVYEKLEFKRGVSPYRAMGIGIDPRNEVAYMEWLMSALPGILGTEEIPEDIIASENHWLADQYLDAFEVHLKSVIGRDLYLGPVPLSNSDRVAIVDYLDYNPWSVLHSRLASEGYRMR